MSKHKGYRCHITALLALVLPGIDANDLEKTRYTLDFIQSVAYSIPMVPLVKEGSHIHDTTLAKEWVQGEMDRMEREGQNVKFAYKNELSDEDEASILRSSTAGFGEFISTLLDKVFTLLENLPGAKRVQGSTPEANVINALQAALSPLFASLSPELFDMALEKIATFVSSHVVHQERDAMGWILNALCKVSPEKTLKVFVPMLVVNIRNEIDINNAASDRSTGTDYLPRDRALVWYIRMLAMAVLYVGSEVLKYKDDLLGIAEYMQEKCRGLPSFQVSSYIHHLLLNLTQTYPIDHALYEPEVIKRGIDVDDWGRTTPPNNLTIRWHQPSPAEIDLAVELFTSQTTSAKNQLESLMSDNPPVSRTGKNKGWSDEVCRLMKQIQLVISGMANMFDPERAAGILAGNTEGGHDVARKDDDEMMIGEDPLAEVAEDEELRPQFRYEAGYVLKPSERAYREIHDLREEVGHLLNKTHSFLYGNQADDVNSFTALYAAYRTWITDVGIELSTDPLEKRDRLYKLDIAAFRIKGLRKVYPRPLLIKRAEIYQLLRQKHNASSRQKSELDKRLLLDLAESSLSLYADVRREAQSALDSSLKSLIGSKPLVIPIILEKFRQAIATKDHDRIKGGMHTLFFTSLLRTLARDWRFAPEAMRLYIETAGIDKPSIQKLGSSALKDLMDFGRPFELMVIVDDALVDTVKPAGDVSVAIETRHQFILQRRRRVEESKSSLGLELTQRAKGAHWKIATLCVIFATNLCLRFHSLAPAEFVDLAANGTKDPHPALRGHYLNCFTSVFASVHTRAVCGHEYRNYLLEKAVDDRNQIQVAVEKGDADFTHDFLESFKQPEDAPYMVDADHPGWLVWGEKFTAYRAKPPQIDQYDEVEGAVRDQLGQILNREWLSQYFDYLKQEEQDASTDQFRVHNVRLLVHVFDLMHRGKTEVTLEDVKELTKEVLEDGNDKHQHRATSEILGALLAGSRNDPPEIRNRVWEYAAPLMLKILADDLTPDNSQYWFSCLDLILNHKDPRRSPEIVDALRSFRLDMTSNAAFKESSKVQLLECIVAHGGWHFQHEKPILDDLLAHIDHPYGIVRMAIGRALSVIYKTRYHESFENVNQLLEENKATSSIGIRPYRPTEEFATTMKGVFDRLEEWRHERTPGQETPSSYTLGSKTVLTWLYSTLLSHECIQMVPFFPTPFMEELLHMMDVKEDPELEGLAYLVYLQLPDIPFRDGEDADFIDALIRIGKTSTSWSQRSRALVNMQVIYFRRIFLTRSAQKEALFAAVTDMLGDSQIEVRSCASTTLAGMIRCSPRRIRDPMAVHLKTRFEDELQRNPMPKRGRHLPGTDTPVDTQKQITRRHAAVLGLGALIKAFPYATPPPEWMPELLATLARKAAADPGVVGDSAKTILSEFKNMRQDSWTMDQKYFTPEQLNDFEGVLQENYFA
ncbi:proteasome activator subunit 4 [Fusarium albosuccineum]|uniref:Proteasome activator subunit 4 n=1 Tax=Fusarium albosuccineum TaxID=1237068 RepID=A0A8H4P3G1_9HYPO|nr:proteasome activator subunit 4 [Fusarium albosuccineum]